MTLEQCRQEAIRMSYLADDKWVFEVNGHKLTWIDPWLGLFTMDGQEGFMMASDFAGVDMNCQNMRLTVAAR